MNNKERSENRPMENEKDKTLLETYLTNPDKTLLEQHIDEYGVNFTATVYAMMAQQLLRGVYEWELITDKKDVSLDLALIMLLRSPQVKNLSYDEKKEKIKEFKKKSLEFTKLEEFLDLLRQEFPGAAEEYYSVK